MDDQRLRDLARDLRDDLDRVIGDGGDRERVRAELDDALTRPEGQAGGALLAVLRARPETRAWVGAHQDEEEVDRGIPGPLGIPTEPLGLHVVCPNGDYDRYLESPDQATGHCPYDGSRLIPVDD